MSLSGARENVVGSGLHLLVEGRPFRGLACVLNGVGGDDDAGVGPSALCSDRNSNGCATQSRAAKSKKALDSTQAWGEMAISDESEDGNDCSSEKPRSSCHPVYGALATQVLADAATAEDAAGSLSGVDDTLRIATQRNRASSMSESTCKDSVEYEVQDDSTSCGSRTRDNLARCRKGDRWADPSAGGGGNELEEGRGSPGNVRPQRDHDGGDNVCRKDWFHICPGDSIAGLTPRRLPPSTHLRQDAPKTSCSIRERGVGIVTSCMRNGSDQGRSSEGTQAVGGHHPCTPNRAGTFVSKSSASFMSGDGFHDERSLSRSGDKIVPASYGPNEVLAHHPVFGVIPAFASVGQLFALPAANAGNEASDIPGLPSWLPIGSDSTTPLKPNHQQLARQDHQRLRVTDIEPRIGIVGDNGNRSGKKSTERRDVTAARDNLDVDAAAVGCPRGPVRRKKRVKTTCLPAHGPFDVPVPPVLLPEDLLDSDRAESTRARGGLGGMNGSPAFHSSAIAVSPDPDENEGLKQGHSRRLFGGEHPSALI